MNRANRIATRFHSLGSDSPPYIIAEIGLNHNGNLDLARDMIREAARCGVHAVKFQLFSVESFLSPGEGGKDRSILDFFSRYTFSEKEWRTLFEEATSIELDFLCSVFDRDSLEFYRSLSPSAVKIASGDVSNRLLIEDVVATGLPLLLSTGTAGEKEVERALSWIPETIPLVLFQCVSAYPAPVEEMNLRVLSRWKEKYAAPVGLSDHTMGNEISLGAIALGGCAIERHFTLDRNMEGPDQKLSLEPREMKSLVEESRRLYSALGNGEKETTPGEAGARSGGRRSLHFARDLVEGSSLRREDLLPLRPGGGADAAFPEVWIGRILRNSVRKGEPIQEKDFEPTQ